MKTDFHRLFLGFSVFGICAGFTAFANESSVLSRGERVFKTNCVACHGEKGDGKGVAAAAIPGKKPRDFTQGKFLYGSTDAEIFKTITQGVPGSAMPPWSALPEDDRKAVVQFIRTLKK